VNGFFVALTRAARDRNDGTRLARWWNEARSREACGNLVRPDGHGVWHSAGQAVAFWLEMDLGTESLARVASKLAGYAHLGSRRAYPVLFWLPNTARETHLHALLAGTGLPEGVSVATAADDHAAQTGGPAGPVWRAYGHPGRALLADLPVATLEGEPWDG
jgi:hypothetical protein